MIPEQTLSEQPCLGPPQKSVNCNFSSPELDKPYGVRKLSISGAYIWSFSRIAQKIKKITPLLIFCMKTYINFARLSFMVRL